MTAQPLVITFANAAAANPDSVLLEQEAWDPYINYLTKAGVIGYLNKQLFDAPYEEPVCIGTDGSYSKALYAYPSRTDLAYNLGLSHGELSDRAINVLEYAEGIQCDLKETLTPKYPVIEILRYAWVGDTYDQDGNLVPKPAVTLVDTVISLDATVYGTLLVTYTVMQHRYTVDIDRRQDAAENTLTSFAYAVWSGGNTYMEVTAPNGAESGACNSGGGSTGKFITHPYVPDYVTGQDEDHVFYYCTNLEKPAPTY